MRKVMIRACALGFVAGTAMANDSFVGYGIGGLELRSTETVAMLREDLTIRPNRVQVRYVYRNETAEPVTAMVAFPLPEYTIPADPWDRLPDNPAAMDFDTRVDGQSVALELDAIARLDGVERSADLQRLGLPMQPLRGHVLHRAVAELPEEARDWLRAEGLLSADGLPNWTLQTVFLREQQFPPGEEVVVEHSYVPMSGGMLDSWFPGPEDISVFAQWDGLGPWHMEMHETYCPTPEIRARGRAQMDGQTGIAGFHTWTSEVVEYVLTTGANWRGPIGLFRLVVEADDPWDFVLLCLPGARWVSQSRVEFEARDFVPDRDLAIHFARAAGYGVVEAREAGLLPPPFSDVSP